jgi:hypothetical protein
MLDIEAGDIRSMQSNTGANADGMGGELTKVVIVTLRTACWRAV